MKSTGRLLQVFELVLCLTAIISCALVEKIADKKPPTTETLSTPVINTLDQMIKNGPSKTGLSQAEQELYDLIMQYRSSKGLPNIPVSKSLSFVAKLHVRDLSTHTFPAPANMHSWSADGPWKPVNYTPDHAHADLMWSKPSELTMYKSEGFEIAYMSSGGVAPISALSGWKGSSGHNSVIINAGVWTAMEWKAIGIGIYGNYAVVWFGAADDPQK
jgi:uncharacterized protein YkwD